MQYSEKVEPVIRQVRDVLMPFYGNVSRTANKSDDAFDIVTELDIKAEEFLAERLKTAFPDIEFVGEESGGNRNAERFWLVDPIDGTQHFVRGMPFCTTMVALIEGSEVVFGAIYDFVKDDLYLAEKGHGATLNGQKIKVSDRSLKESFMGWEIHLDKPENLKIFLELEKRCAFFKAVVAGYEFALVASGKIDGRISFDPYGKDYDFAPGALLVAEAGGVVANLGSRSYDYRNTDFIAANPRVFKELTEGDDAIFPITE